MPDLMGPPAPAPILAHLEAVRRERAPLNLALLMGPPAASLYDAIATQDAMHRGGHEANPVLAPFVHNEPLFYVTKLGSGFLAGLAANALAKRGHRTMGKIVSGLSIGIPLAAGTSNLLHGRDHQERR